MKQSISSLKKLPILIYGKNGKFEVPPSSHHLPYSNPTSISSPQENFNELFKMPPRRARRRAASASIPSTSTDPGPPLCSHCGNPGHVSDTCPRSDYSTETPALTCPTCVHVVGSAHAGENPYQIVHRIIPCPEHVTVTDPPPPPPPVAPTPPMWTPRTPATSATKRPNGFYFL